MTTILHSHQEQLSRHSERVRQLCGGLSASQLNWKAHPKQWSVAQCLDHLITTNEKYRPVLEAAAAQSGHSSIWQRLPFLADLAGRMLLNATQPQGKGKMKTPGIFEPAASDLPADIVAQFTAHNAEMAGLMARLEGLDLRKTIIQSPVGGPLVLRLSDALRVIVQHEERHINQLERVMAADGFPG